MRQIYLCLSVLAFAGCLGKGIEPATSASTGKGSTPTPATPSPTPAPTPAPAPSPSPTPAPAPALCSPLAASAGTVINVTPAQANQLPSIVASAPSNSVILLADGVYNINSGIMFSRSNVTMRAKGAQLGQSYDNSRVVIDGLNGFSGPTGGSANDTRVQEIIGIVANNITISDLTIKNSYYHLIHIQTSGQNTLNTKIYNVHLIDSGEQAIKINTIPGSGFYTDAGEVSCSTIELTDTARPWIQGYFDGCYTGGIDAHQSKGWKISNNTFRGFWCPIGLAEATIHFWTGSRDTLVEGNNIINSARGIGFGLGTWDGVANSRRNYSDGVCGGKQNLGHYGGIIRNNRILVNDPHVTSSAAGFDNGISFEEVCQGKILNNTIVSTVGNGSSSIEYRFNATTQAEVMNNLVSFRVIARDGGTGTSTNNVSGISTSWFKSLIGNGDLHLNFSVPSLVGTGTPTTDVTTDMDGDIRKQNPDIGADEY